MDLIPNEILEKIFGYTNFDTILSLSAVCKLFRSIIGSHVLLNLHDIENIIFRANGFKRTTYWYEFIKLVAIKRGYVEINDVPCFVLKCDLDMYQKNMLDVKQNGNTLYYIKNQTDKICLVAVQQNGNALQYVKKQTDKICIAAVKNNGEVLQYVKNQTPEICLKAIAQTNYALRYVKNQTYEICLAAITQNGYTLSHVQNQTYELCLAAVQQYG